MLKIIFDCQNIKSFIKNFRKFNFPLYNVYINYFMPFEITCKLCYKFNVIPFIMVNFINWNNLTTGIIQQSISPSS